MFAKPKRKSLDRYNLVRADALKLAAQQDVGRQESGMHACDPRRKIASLDTSYGLPR